MWSHSSSSQASPVSRPRVEGDAVIIGKSTVLARRVVRSGCWEVEKHHPAALSRLLSMAYGKRISTGSDMVKLLEKAAAALPRNLREADQIISGLPEPLAEAEDRVQAANRLLKDGGSLYQLETAMRGEQLGLRPAPAWAERLTLCDKGVVLGKGTVIVGLTDLPYGGTVFDMEGKEADILAMLSVARRGLAPVEMLAKLAAASRALTEGDVSRAAIALAQTGQPALTDEALAKSLTFAANKLKRGMKPYDLMKASGLLPKSMTLGQWDAWSKGNPNHVPAGCPEGGQFTSGDQATSGTGSNNTKTKQKSIAAPISANGSTGPSENSSQNQTTSKPVQVTLNDGSTVVGPDGKPMQMPSPVSLGDNVALGESLKELGPGLREQQFLNLFRRGHEMDYQMTYSQDGVHYNQDYIDFGNYNYGAVAAAAGMTETEMLGASGLYNMTGKGDKSAIYGNNPRNLAMIMQGYKDYKDGKITPSKKASEAQRMLLELN